MKLIRKMLRWFENKFKYPLYPKLQFASSEPVCPRCGLTLKDHVVPLRAEPHRN